MRTFKAASANVLTNDHQDFRVTLSDATKDKENTVCVGKWTSRSISERGVVGFVGTIREPEIHANEPITVNIHPRSLSEFLVAIGEEE